MIELLCSVRGSSNGRTAAFEAVNLGSNPSPRTVCGSFFKKGPKYPPVNITNEISVHRVEASCIIFENNVNIGCERLYFL